MTQTFPWQRGADTISCSQYCLDGEAYLHRASRKSYCNTIWSNSSTISPYPTLQVTLNGAIFKSLTGDLAGEIFRFKSWLLGANHWELDLWSLRKVWPHAVRYALNQPVSWQGHGQIYIIYIYTYIICAITYMSKNSMYVPIYGYIYGSANLHINIGYDRTYDIS